jgi:hypothetical protein
MKVDISIGKTPAVAATVWLAVTLVACGENTKLIGTGAPQTQSDAASPPVSPDTGPTCPPRVCTAVYCQYGNKQDDHGCPTCECNAPPTAGCAAVQCPAGQHCELQQVMCIKAPCDPVPTCVPAAAPDPDPCAAARCPAGTTCQAKQVSCVRAPCPPVAECVPKVSCGGFAGKPCPGSGTCQDDPTDSCDPAAGGADCIGLCVCKPAACPSDRVWDGSPAVCACVPVTAGESCGNKTCGAGEFCCNRSCSLCAPVGGVCVALQCGP